MHPLSLLTAERFLPQVDAVIQKLEGANSDAPVFIAPESELERLTGFELTRGALAAFRRPPERPVEEVVAQAHVVAVLENIRNHTNVGAIFRSAAALGADAVLVSPACYDPLYRRAVRVSMGTVFQVPWTRIGSDPHDWAREGVPLLHELGFTVAALALDKNAMALDDPLLKEVDKLALVLGTEGDGLAPSTIASCDHTVIIPMEHGVDSLNVAAASAVAFWELRRPV
jgi:tRNA G18 (ribose-2'-O)-methylase SpoU